MLMLKLDTKLDKILKNKYIIFFPVLTTLLSFFLPADVCPGPSPSLFLSLVPALSLVGLSLAVQPLYEHVLLPHFSSSKA